MTAERAALRWCEALARRAFTSADAEHYLALVAEHPGCANPHLLRAMLAVGQTLPPGSPNWQGLQAYWRNWTTRVRGWLGVDAAQALAVAHGAIPALGCNAGTTSDVALAAASTLTTPSGERGAASANLAAPAAFTSPVCAISEARLRQLWQVIGARFALPGTADVADVAGAEVIWQVGAARAETRTCFGTLVVAVRAGDSWAAWAEALHECGHAAWRLAGATVAAAATLTGLAPTDVQLARSLDEGIAECFASAVAAPWFIELVQAWSRAPSNVAAPANLGAPHAPALQAQCATVEVLAQQHRAARYHIAVQLAELEAELARGALFDDTLGRQPTVPSDHVPWALWHQPGTAQSYLAGHAWFARLAPAFTAGGAGFWDVVTSWARDLDAAATQWLQAACHHNDADQEPGYEARGAGHAWQT